MDVIRPALLDDAPAIARVHIESWRSTYRRLLAADFLDSLELSEYTNRWTRFIGDGTSRVYVAEDGGAVVGFASGGHERAGEVAYSGELYAIYVLDAFQRRGHGLELVRAVVGGLQEMGLDDMIIWVLKDNRPARLFYERLGGVYVRTQPITVGSASLEEVSYGWPRLDLVRY